MNLLNLADRVQQNSPFQIVEGGQRDLAEVFACGEFPRRASLTMSRTPDRKSLTALVSN